MSGKRRGWISFLMLFLAVVSLCPKTVRAEKRFDFSVKDGVLTVWGKGAMPYTDFDDELPDGDWEIKKIIVKEGITSLPEYAFAEMHGVREAEIAHTVKKIGKGAFAECDRLKRVVLPDGLKKIPADAFSECIALEDVILPKTVEVIGARAFEYTRVPSSILRQGKIKEIGRDAFCHTGWRTLVLPKTVKKVAANAFSIFNLERVIICGSTRQIHNRAFNAYSYSNYRKLVLTYKSGAREWQTALWERFLQGEYHLCWQKVSGADGYQIQISRDRSFRTTKTYDVEENKNTLPLKTLKPYADINFFRIRPYKLVKGKKVFGRWAENEGW